MTIYLTHFTALEVWRRLDRRLPVTSLDDSSLGSDLEELEIAACKLPLLRRLPRPLHVSVPSLGARRQSRAVRCHAQSPGLFPPLYCLLADGVYVSSPELCLAQLVRRIELVDLIEMGFELCGRYARRSDLPDGMLRRGQPLSSTKQLEDFGRRLQGKGSQCDKYMRAVRYVYEGSESPKETIQAMIATLPFKLGGYDMVGALLNPEIPIPGELRKTAGKASYRPDLFWPQANVDLEYDSSDFHERNSSGSADSRRRSVLELMGIDVQTNTPGQLYDKDATDALMGLLRHKLGLRKAPTDPTHLAARMKLRDRLLGNSRL